MKGNVVTGIPKNLHMNLSNSITKWLILRTAGALLAHTRNGWATINLTGKAHDHQRCRVCGYPHAHRSYAHVYFPSCGAGKISWRGALFRNLSDNGSDSPHGVHAGGAWERGS